MRHLTTMTSGVKWNEDYTDPNADDQRIWALPVTSGNSPVLAYMRRLPRAHLPGATFHYSSGDVTLAGIMVTNAVGNRYRSTFQTSCGEPTAWKKTRCGWWTQQAKSSQAEGLV